MNERRLLEESIQNLIAISDMLESVRKKYKTPDMYGGQKLLCNAIEVFKREKNRLKTEETKLRQLEYNEETTEKGD